MDHHDIEERHIPQLYLAGKLLAEEAALFEEHYLHCRECLERLELAGSLRRGLGQLAADELSARALVSQAGRITLLRFRMLWGLAGLLVIVALLPTVYLYRQLGEAGRALEEEHQPGVNTPILHLSPSRSADFSTPEYRVTLSGSPEWFVLALEVVSTAAETYETYRVSLYASDRELRWQRSGLVPNDQGSLVIHFHSSFPGPGDYLLSVEGIDGAGEGIFLAPFSLRIAEMPTRSSR